MSRRCMRCAAALSPAHASLPAFSTGVTVASPLRRVSVATCRARARAWKAHGVALRRARMTMSSSSSSDEDSTEDSFNPSSQPLNLDVLRRRIIDLDARQKAGHKPTDYVTGSAKDSNGNTYEIRYKGRGPDLQGHNDDDDDTEVLQLINDFESLRKVWVIVFTNARDSSEGIYSLSVADENIVLAFQDKEEAQRYALCLEQQQFPLPKVAELETNELTEFCSESGFRLGFVPKGSLITPPEQSAVEDLDKWRPPESSSSKGNELGMTQDEIDTMRKKLDSLFGL